MNHSTPSASNTDLVLAALRDRVAALEANVGQREPDEPALRSIARNHESRLKRGEGQRSRFFWYLIAITVAVMFVVAVVWYTNNRINQGRGTYNPLLEELQCSSTQSQHIRMLHNCPPPRRAPR